MMAVRRSSFRVCECVEALVALLQLTDVSSCQAMLLMSIEQWWRLSACECLCISMLCYHLTSFAGRIGVLAKKKERVCPGTIMLGEWPYVCAAC